MYKFIYKAFDEMKNDYNTIEEYVINILNEN